MTRRLLFPIMALALFAAACSTAPQEELAAARRAVAQAYASGAPEVAPEEYRAATEHLEAAEVLIQKGEYDQARRLLPQAEFHAGQAILLGYGEEPHPPVGGDMQDGSPELGGAARPTKPRRPARTVQPKTPLKVYVVREGETLWTIAARRAVYGESLLWPLIYKANRDQIKDPQQIFPNQVLNIPRDVPEEEKEAAREKARRSRIFPQETLPRGPSEKVQ